MKSLNDIRANTPKKEIFRGQVQHAMLAILLYFGAVSLLGGNETTFLAVKADTWAIIAIWVALVHQIIVAIVFRLQLHFNLMVRLFGDNALKIWGIIFLPMLIARPIVLLLAGIADFRSMGGNYSLMLLAGGLIFLLVPWTMYSVLKHFTINRALGGDHFYDEYLNKPIVNEGAFRYSPNAMYSFVFAGMWGLALMLGSWNALVVALFYHAYIWVHMYCTEDPDMKILYGGK